MAGIRDALKKARRLEEGKGLEVELQQPNTHYTQGKHFATKIYSELLDKEIWFVSDEKAVKTIDDDLATFFPEEIEDLADRKLSPDEIRAIHMIKEVFPGSKIVWN